MLPVALLLQGISYRLIQVPTLTYISTKEFDYVKAYREDNLIKSNKNTPGNKNFQSNQGETETVENQEDTATSLVSNQGDLHVKKTWLIVLSVCTFLPALFGQGKFYSYSQIHNFFCMKTQSFFS